ncbi:MAG: hypothetical protein PCFJNLEI_00779 [Verrucomicrobiae bacterium]|nr:hypothetical protein [Verrucomicrobiae bacterium]
MAIGISDFLTPEAMRKLDGFVLRSRYVVEGFQVGSHASPLKGASVEFNDYRQYVKGDNLRNLDWKVFGRTDRYYIKQFEEETNLRVQVIIDGSGSMGYGSAGQKTKYEYACHVAAALGYIVSKERDSLGVTIYDNEVRQHVPARSGKRHLRVFLERLAGHTPKNRTDTGLALHALAEMISRRGMIVLLSDLFDDPPAVFNALAHFRKKMHDVILLQILDPVELDLAIDRMAEFIDMETGEKLEIDPSSARLAYKQELQKLIDQCREKCAVLNVDYRLVSTDQGFEDFVHQYLMERRRMSL